MKTLVIVPTYNEKENLPLIVPAILGQSDQLEVLVVDDNSPDGTGDIADRLAAENGRVHVLHREGKRGLGTAYIAGFKYALAADYGAIIEMDADFSHDPADLTRLIAGLLQADVVIGSRWIKGGKTVNWSPLRAFISRGGSWYARTVLSMPLRDLTSGFKCFRREVLQTLKLDNITSNGYGFQVEVNYLCHKAGFRLLELPIIFPDRKLGRSKMSGQIVLEAVALVWKLRLRSTASPEINFLKPPG